MARGRYDAQRFRSSPPRTLALGGERLKLVGQVFAAYEATMRAENTIDFDDMLILATTLLRHDERVRRKYARHWRHVLVDEFQVGACTACTRMVGMRNMSTCMYMCKPMAGILSHVHGTCTCLVGGRQDTNGVQYTLLSQLGRDHKNLFVVGDVDQAIYGVLEHAPLSCIHMCI